MKEGLFQVVFAGVLTGEFEEAESIENLTGAFKLNDTQRKSFQQNNERIIKKKAQESQAITLMFKVIACGYDCYVQEIPEDGQDYDEKRGNNEQRLKFRRGPRPGAIIPDRRLVIQRKRDVRTFTQLLEAEEEPLPFPFESYPHNQSD